MSHASDSEISANVDTHFFNGFTLFSAFEGMLHYLNVFTYFASSTTFDCECVCTSQSQGGGNIGQCECVDFHDLSGKVCDSGLCVNRSKVRDNSVLNQCLGAFGGKYGCSK